MINKNFSVLSNEDNVTLVDILFVLMNILDQIEENFNNYGKSPQLWIFWSY